ncbi:hypothetical protein [Aequorivita sp. KMM 9714]|uniref:hypothetical protein n=1 Tax=Aequorivita sp. KMM 9714 TaxID=2707173 RepID=UPI0013E9B255|nr:hypothetical protein [Aequorivita sp. KMM 9714]NGX85149.1 hypothetical protein [Aequorivita sp. KMM 9714]
MKNLNSIFILIVFVGFVGCNNGDKPENLNQFPESKINSKKKPELKPKFIVYQGDVTVPYYPDLPEMGGITENLTLRVSTNFDEASLNGPMTKIKETRKDVYTFIDGAILGMSIYLKEDFAIVYGIEGEQFATIYKTKFEY